MSEGNVRSGEAQRDLGPRDALALLRSWLGAMNLEVDERRLIAAPAGRRHRPPGPLPPRPPDPRARARAGRARHHGRDRGGPAARLRPRRRRAVRRLRPGDPVRRRDRVPRAREAEADAQRRRPAARRARRRRPRRHARRDPHDPADPRPRRARVRGRGDRHRRRRRPPAERRRRGRRALLQRPEDRRAEHHPRSPRRSPRAATTWSTSAAPARRASPPGASRSCSSCRCSAATTPSWPPTPACAPGYGHLEALANFALGKFYGACDVVLSPSAPPTSGSRQIGVEPRDHRPLGPRRRSQALRSGAARPGAAARARSTSSTPAG